MFYLEQTTVACPSQFEGHLEDGKTFFYIRYRSAHLRIYFGTSITNCLDNEASLDMYVGEDPLDGWIEWDEVKPYFERAVQAYREGRVITE